MGCIFTKDEDYLDKGDERKMLIAKHIFKELDNDNDSKITSFDLEHYHEYVMRFFENRVSYIDNLIYINNTVKKGKKILEINVKEVEMNEIKNKYMNESIIKKNDIDNTFEYKKSSISTAKIKLELELAQAIDKNRVDKNNIDTELEKKLENINIDIENERKACNEFYSKRCSDLTKEKDAILELLKNNNITKIHNRFISYFNKNKKQDYFDEKDCLRYFKNKSIEETLILLKYINKGKYLNLK